MDNDDNSRTRNVRESQVCAGVLVLPDIKTDQTNGDGEKCCKKMEGICRCLQSMWELAADFCANSTLHGVRFFTESNRHWTERIWWFGMVAFFVYCCGYSIMKVAEKYEADPFSSTEKRLPVWKIPFPAVTICPEVKVKKEHLDFTATYRLLMESKEPPFNISDSEFELFEIVNHFCEPQLTSFFGNASRYAGYSIYEKIHLIAPNLGDVCVGPKNDCWEAEPILTEEGLCFTFNAVDLREIIYAHHNFHISGNLIHAFEKAIITKLTQDWLLGTGYDTWPPDWENIYRSSGAGPKRGVNGILHQDTNDIDHLCRSTQGYKLILHVPDELPQVSTNYIHLPFSKKVNIAIKPRKIQPSISLYQSPPNFRKCFLSEDRVLRFFNIYTQHHCELECLSNLTRENCGCVPPSLPHDSETNICGGASIECYKKVEYNFTEYCDCLPSCTQITYDAEITETSDNKREQMAILLDDDQLFKGKETVSFSIFFKEDEFTSVTNMHSLRAFDYIANCGGLLSLFLGGSLLSFFEVLYYLSLRLGCSAHRRLRTKPTANADSICRTVCSRCCTSFTYISSTLLFLFSLCFGYILLRMIMGNNQYDSRH